MATIKICDICKSSEKVMTLSFWVNRRMDAAGSMSDEFKTFDLCWRCELAVLRVTIAALVDSHYQCGDYGGHVSGPIKTEIVTEMIRKSRKKK